MSRSKDGMAERKGGQEIMLQRRFVRPSEVARLLGVSRSTVYRWFWEGKLKGIKFGEKNIRIAFDSIEKIISECW